jgi:hypothetical protein
MFAQNRMQVQTIEDRMCLTNARYSCNYAYV